MDKTLKDYFKSHFPSSDDSKFQQCRDKYYQQIIYGNISNATKSDEFWHNFLYHPRVRFIIRLLNINPTDEQWNKLWEMADQITPENVMDNSTSFDTKTFEPISTLDEFIKMFSYHKWRFHENIFNAFSFRMPKSDDVPVRMYMIYYIDHLTIMLYHDYMYYTIMFGLANSDGNPIISSPDPMLEERMKEDRRPHTIRYKDNVMLRPFMQKLYEICDNKQPIFTCKVNKTKFIDGSTKDDPTNTISVRLPTEDDKIRYGRFASMVGVPKYQNCFTFWYNYFPEIFEPSPPLLLTVFRQEQDIYPLLFYFTPLLLLL